MSGYTSIRAALESASTDLPGEPVATSESQVITQSRLAALPTKVMDIHALENDLAAINQQGEQIEIMQGAAEEVLQYKEILESRIELGGITSREAEILQVAIESITDRLGGFSPIKIPAMESFDTSVVERVSLTTALESEADGFFSKAWKVIKDFFKSIADKVKSWFGKSKDKAEEAVKTLEELLKLNTDIPADKLEGFKDIIGEVPYRKLGEKFTADAVKDVFEKQLTATNGLLSGYNTNIGTVQNHVKTISEAIASGNDLVASVNGITSDKQTEVYKGLLGINESGTTDQNDDKKTVFKSATLIGGVYNKLVVTASTDGNGYAHSVEKVEVGENEQLKSASDIKPADNQKLAASAFSEDIKKMAAAARQIIPVIDGSLGAIKNTVGYLDKSVADDMFQGDQKKDFEKATKVVKELCNFVIKSPLMSVFTAFFKSVNGVEAMVLKANKEANSAGQPADATPASN